MEKITQIDIKMQLVGWKAGSRHAFLHLIPQFRAQKKTMQQWICGWNSFAKSDGFARLCHFSSNR